MNQTALNEMFAGLEGTGPIHDEVVLMAEEKVRAILEQAVDVGVFDVFDSVNDIVRQPQWSLLPSRDWRVRCELEWKIEHRFVDLMVYVGDQPVLLLEAKSEREPQAASEWSRQMRWYSESARLPCVLVIAHSLGDVQRRYLDRVGVTICDLRKLPVSPKAAP